MSARLHVLHVALVTLECTTPLSLSTGANDTLFDTVLARDGNGLPMIPGTSLAGVLRHLYTARHGGEAANALFGLDAIAIRRLATIAAEQADETAQEEESYQASPLHVSAALLHDSHDRPIAATPMDEAMQQDALVKHALSEQPIERDHVKLDHRGVAAATDRGKFTRAGLARGNRFTFELSLWSAEKPDPRWTELRDLFAHTAFRLGGGTRRGFGEVKVERWRERLFNMHHTTDVEAYRAFHETAGAGDRTGFGPGPEPAVADKSICAKLTLQPDDLFRFGGGKTPLRVSRGKPPTMLPLAEPCVVWEDDGQGGQRGKLSEHQPVIPASAIKGAIRHRVAFHYNRLTRRFISEHPDQEEREKHDKTIRENNPAEVALFGHQLTEQRSDRDAHAGRVLISDLLLSKPGAEQIGWMTHNSIDRFSGGTRRGVLYTEELLFEYPLHLAITVLQSDDSRVNAPNVRNALREALNDLAQGRLALGAGASKGHGYFTASRPIKWSDEGAWIDGDQA